ncbi:MAG: nucleotidyltransferase domain-containing protein [Candidatus Nanopelagicales bacterium]
MGWLVMDMSNPARAVIPTLDADVLRVLAGTTRPMTGHQVHRVAGVGSRQGVANVLARLVDVGLVHVTDAGSAYLYVLNREHVAAPAVLALQDLRGELFTRIRTTVEAWPVAPLALSVFGSVARGDGSTASDVDVLLVRPPGVPEDDPAWAAAVDGLRQGILKWSGNTASIIEVTTDQVGDMVARGEPVVDSLRNDEVPLVGPGVLALVGAAA